MDDCDSIGSARGTIPVKSSLRPFSLRRGGGCVIVGAADARVAPTVRRSVSDRARCGVRRGMKSGPGAGEAGKAGDPERSGDVCRELQAEELAEEPDPSCISVKPNKRGRRPLRCVSCKESAAMAMVRRGGERTSGSTCRGRGMVLEEPGGEGIDTTGTDDAVAAPAAASDCKVPSRSGVGG